MNEYKVGDDRRRATGAESDVVMVDKVELERLQAIEERVLDVPSPWQEGDPAPSNATELFRADRK